MVGRLPSISRITDEPVVLPVQNDTGAARVEGDVVCWKVESTARQKVDVADAVNRYRPAGVVTEFGIGDAGNGWIYRGGGRPVSAKVLGVAGLAAGDPLEVVVDQVYLAKVAAPVAGLRYPFVAAEAYETAAVALKLVYVDCEV